MGSPQTPTEPQRAELEKAGQLQAMAAPAHVAVLEVTQHHHLHAAAPGRFVARDGLAEMAFPTARSKRPHSPAAALTSAVSRSIAFAARTTSGSASAYPSARSPRARPAASSPRSRCRSPARTAGAGYQARLGRPAASSSCRSLWISRALTRLYDAGPRSPAFGRARFATPSCNAPPLGQRRWRRSRAARSSSAGGTVSRLRRDARAPRVVDRREHAFVDLPVPLAQSRPALSSASVCSSFIIRAHRVGQVRELERQQVGVGQPDHRGADGLRQRPAVDEVGVEELRVADRSRRRSSGRSRRRPRRRSRCSASACRGAAGTA